MSEESACPGIDSKQAGQSSACAGCPNKEVCMSGDFQTKDIKHQIEAIARKLSSITNIIIVMSGKGGVGKSTVSSQLARYVAMNNPRITIGLLDIDICGPSIPKTMGIENEEIFNSASGWSPVFVQDNLAVMSCGLLLESLDSAVIWRSAKKTGIIKQFFYDVDWGDLDYLIIDTPPGTSDEHLTLSELLRTNKNLKGVVMVTTPQELAQMDVRKQMEFCRLCRLHIIGYIENMSMFVCPKCNKDNIIFKSSEISIEKKFGIKLLGRIPLDPAIGKSCDEGVSLFTNESIQSKTKEAFAEIWTNIVNEIK